MKRAISKLQDMIETHVEPRLGAATSATLLLKSFGLFKVPLLFAANPTVIELTDKRIVVRIPLSRKTKNHLNTMYFGALAIGADAVVGLLGMHHIRKKKVRGVHLSFKDFKADFLKRPDGDVHFICDYGEEMNRFIDKVAASSERHNLTVPAYAIVPARHPTDPVAKFELTLSLKRKE